MIKYTIVPPKPSDKILNPTLVPVFFSLQSNTIIHSNIAMLNMIVAIFKACILHLLFLFLRFFASINSCLQSFIPDARHFFVFSFLEGLSRGLTPSPVTPAPSFCGVRIICKKRTLLSLQRLHPVLYYLYELNHLQNTNSKGVIT